MEDLTNTIALVTGGGSGINLAFVQLLHQHGVKILVADLALNPLAQQWISSLPSIQQSSVHFHQTDVTSWPSLTSSLDACESHFGGVPDIVVPGAGIYEPGRFSFWTGDEDEGASRFKILDVNLVHPIKLTRLAVKRMLGSGKVKGAVVCVSSIAGQGASVGAPLYTASKHGINGFVRSLGGLEEMVGIRVMAVAPGPVLTPLWSNDAERFIDKENDVLLPPEEVARAMLALVTDKKYESGTILEVCDVEGRWREVKQFNDPGPSGPATSTVRRPLYREEAMKALDSDKGTRTS